MTRKFSLGDRVQKIKGSKWTGRVVGFYSTSLTPVGYCVESETETGSVQIYPEAALSEGLAAAGVTVKPLEWNEEENGEFIAQSDIGWYHIGMPHQWWNLTMPSGEVPSFRSLDEAKDAAQADFERRILSAIASAKGDEA